MKSARTIIALCSALAFLHYASLLAQNPSGDFKLLYNDGKVFYQRAGSEGWVTADTLTVFLSQDRIRTDDRTNAEFALEGKTVLRLGPSSTVSISVVESAHAIDSGVVLTGLAGDIWINEARVDSTSRLSVSWAFRERLAAVSSLADTVPAVYRVAVGVDSTTEIKVYQSSVSVRFFGIETLADSASAANYLERESRNLTDRPRSDEFELILQAYQNLLLAASGKIVYQGAFTPDDPDENNTWIEWNKTRDSSLLP